jgi:methyltransferase
VADDMIWFLVLILATGAERIAEVVISRRNATWAFERGGKEYGQSHYPYMVVLHTGFLLACLAEVFLGNRPFIPLLGWPMLAIAIACQGLRYWCIGTLGRQWNSRIVVVPGLGRVTRGPYRLFSHPNYAVVIAEGIALPLVYTAWITAIAFTVLNAILLFGFRIPAEERALEALRVEPGR